MRPRGLRNNNPLNLRHNKQLWQGLSATQTDRSFLQFQSMAWGYRAAMVVIRTYVMSRGVKTLGAILSRWAPDADGNDEDLYLARVRALTGLERTSVIDPLDHDTMVSLVSAMSRVENGIAAVPADVEAGWKLYFN